VPLIANPPSYAAIEIVGEGRKDLASSPEIEIKECCDIEPGSQAKGKDSTSRGPRNKIEVRSDWMSAGVTPLKFRQDGGGKDPADAASIN
jgi:hypothetical protein